ncbi:MAG: hypothetical protein DCC67_20130 [Planctomycetota bacterium]|nr:MAG: hypothetical protein DCC67_20130 [Planctomycetota bacterium]
MYCSECGQQATGKYCSHCGTKLAPASPDASPTNADQASSDWSDVLHYETLLQVPEVRDRIARAAAQATTPMTGEEFLDLCGKAFGKLSGVSLPMAPLARFAQSLHGKLGVKTGKVRGQFVAAPPGSVLASLLCSLARHGRHVRAARQLSDGCILVASLPSDLYALEGDLSITVTRRGGGTHVEAKTHITGQLFDWGKSTRCLDELFTELAAAAATAA